MTITAMRTYPKDVTLGRSDLSLTIRPLQSDDAPELLEFFRRVPEEDRFYLKEEVTSPEVIDRWAKHIDYNRVLPLVALIGGEIVADATLHRSRSKAQRHMGEIRVVVDPRYRNQGLGTLMTREIIDVAYDNALESVVFELVEGKQDDAIKVAERLGFAKVAALPGFFKDLQGKDRKLVVMELPLGDWLEWWAF